MSIMTALKETELLWRELERSGDAVNRLAFIELGWDNKFYQISKAIYMRIAGFVLFGTRRTPVGNMVGIIITGVRSLSRNTVQNTPK